MAAIAVSKSRFVNWLEGVTLTALLQGGPIYASSALILRLVDHEMVGSARGVLIFVLSATLVYGLVAPLLSGPRCRRIFKNGYEPLFFDPSLSLADKVAVWRVQPRVSVQLVTTVIMISLLSVAVLCIR